MHTFTHVDLGSVGMCEPPSTAVTCVTCACLRLRSCTSTYSSDSGCNHCCPWASASCSVVHPFCVGVVCLATDSIGRRERPTHRQSTNHTTHTRQIAYAVNMWLYARVFDLSQTAYGVHNPLMHVQRGHDRWNLPDGLRTTEQNRMTCFPDESDNVQQLIHTPHIDWSAARGCAPCGC